MDKLNANNKIDSLRLIIFLVIAFGLSNIFRFNILHLNEILEENSKWSYLVTQGILEGSGIFLAGILGLHFRMDSEVGVNFGFEIGRKVNKLRWKK